MLKSVCMKQSENTKDYVRENVNQFDVDCTILEGREERERQMESEGQSPRLQMEWLGGVGIYSDHKVGRGPFVSPRGSQEEKCWFPGRRALLVPSFSGGGDGSMESL